ncbi:MAG: DUF971 domain-containing protein [Deltaproteobacteria bacterium]|nr:DUF971 domain-containing protein [Deltaproteobacteria bacterium]
MTEARNDKDARVLHLQWESGAKRALSYAVARGYCPCAHCQGHGAGPRKFIASDAALIGIKAVGHYALQLQWSDGHATGIYTFDYLRELPERAP